MLRMKRDDWDEVAGHQPDGGVPLCQAALKPMIRAAAGRIVAISSVVGQIGNAGQANYAASKAGLIGFCKSLAREVASRQGHGERRGARVHRDRHDARDHRRARKTDWSAQIPLGRVGHAGGRGGGGGFSGVG